MAERVWIDDLLKEILVRLPLKPLIRLKLVSKHWNSIISDPKLHFTRNHNRASGLIFQNYLWNVPIKTRVIVSLDDRNPPHPEIPNNIPNTLRIFHSCNGLLVLKSTVLEEYDYYVYNPTTKQITTKSKSPGRGGMYLAFDPSKSPHYKVVCAWECSNRHEDMRQYQFEVYSSQTGSWETRGGHNTTSYLNLDNGVYWNGAIHWVGFVGKSMFFNPDDDEMPRVMPDPPFLRGGRVRDFFGVSCNHLHFGVVGDRHFCVYEMRRDYSEWFVKYRVDDYSRYLRNSYTVRYLFSVVRGNKDDLLVLGNDEGEIIRYNLANNTFQAIQVKGFDFNQYLTQSFQYIESPCSV